MPTLDAKQKAALAARLAEDKKAEEIVVMDVQGICNFADAFVICTGNSRVQLNAITDAVARGFKKAGFKNPRHDDTYSPNWQVLDFGDVVIHVMTPESRSFYRLEKLWGDAPEVDWAQQAVALPAV